MKKDVSLYQQWVLITYFKYVMNTSTVFAYNETNALQKRHGESVEMAALDTHRLVFDLKSLAAA